MSAYLRHEAERPLLAAAADEDRRAARLHRRRDVVRLVRPVVRALERRRGPGEHGTADLQRLLQPVEPLAGGREVEPQSVVLDVVPGGADTQDRPAAADDVERRDDLGQVRRVPVRHAGDQGAEPHRRGAGRQRAEQRVGVEHRLGGPAQRRQLEEVVHHPDRVVPRLFGGARLVDDVGKE
jgi:hypothetical protein